MTVKRGSGIGNGDSQRRGGGAARLVPDSRLPVPIVHAVTTNDIVGQPDFARRARGVMLALGRRGAVHLRGPRVTAARLLALAEALSAAQQETGAWLVVNDRVDVALAGGARGAQLTSRSLSVADARRVAGTLRLGASVHAAAEAERADRDGADWIVAGNVFATASHPGAPGRGVRLLDALRQASALPCIAIGGVKPGDVAALLDAGVHGVAAISGIWNADDAERAAVEYLSAYDRHRAP